MRSIWSPSRSRGSTTSDSSAGSRRPFFLPLINSSRSFSFPASSAAAGHLASFSSRALSAAGFASSAFWAAAFPAFFLSSAASSWSAISFSSCWV